MVILDVVVVVVFVAAAVVVVVVARETKNTIQSFQNRSISMAEFGMNYLFCSLSFFLSDDPKCIDNNTMIIVAQQID